MKNKWLAAKELIPECKRCGSIAHETGDCQNKAKKQFTLSEVESWVGKALIMQVEASAVAFAFSPEDSDDKYIKDSLLSVSDVMGKDDD